MTDQKRSKARRRIAMVLRRARVASDQSMPDVAAKVSVHTMTWFRWESGEQSIPSELLPVVARSVDLTAEQLLKAA